MKLFAGWVKTFVLSGVIICAPYAAAQDQAVTRRVESGGAEVVLNQVDTSAYPKVTIFATVLREGEPVLGLTDKDFRVREDEVDQEPLTVAPKLTPLNAVVTLDTSGSMKKALPDVKEAAKSFIDVLQSEDRFNVIAFSRQVRVLSAAGDRAAAKSAIDSTVARGDTALYDALYESISQVSGKEGRKAVILLTDGVDDDGSGKQLSAHSVEEGLKLAKSVNLPVFVVGLGSEKDEALLQRIAKETGGRYFSAPSAEQLKEIYDAIGKQLSGQYTIFYTSNLPADGAIHRVTLTHSGVTGVKEYVAPGAAKAAPAAAAVQQASTPVPATAQLIISNAPGLHIAALLAPGGQPVDFAAAKVIRPAQSSFEEEKVLHTCYTERKCSFTVPPGRYIVEVARGQAKVRQEVAVQGNEPVNVPVVLNAGVLNVVAVPVSGAAPLTADHFSVKRQAESAFEETKAFVTCYNDPKCSFTVTAGRYDVGVKEGSAEAVQTIEVKPGESLNVTLVLNAGILNVAPSLVPGGAPIKVDELQVIRPAGDAFSSPQTVGRCYGDAKCSFPVTAGHYQVDVKADAVRVQQEVDVPPGQAVNMNIPLNAGILNAVATVEGRRVKVTEFAVIRPAASALEEAKKLAHCYNEQKCTLVVPTGSLTVEIRKDESKIQKEITVNPGETVNLEVQLVGQ